MVILDVTGVCHHGGTATWAVDYVPPAGRGTLTARRRVGFGAGTSQVRSQMVMVDEIVAVRVEDVTCN